MSQPVTLQLTDSGRQLLLQIARNAVMAYLKGRKPPFPSALENALMETRGVFVSLHQDQELRGCIGNLRPTSPLYRTVAECAIGAAVGDPRFMPLALHELDSVAFEISVISEFAHVRDISEIQIGLHGLAIRKQHAQGLLLPQVAASYNWSRERFLAETCRKAGLRPNDWEEDAVIQTFTATVFSEKQFQVTANE